MESVRITGRKVATVVTPIGLAYSTQDAVRNVYAMWDAMRYAFTVLPEVSFAPDGVIVRLASASLSTEGENR